MLFQTAVGGLRSRRLCIEQYLNTPQGARILDIGCESGFVAAFVPHSTYVDMMWSGDILNMRSDGILC